MATRAEYEASICKGLRDAKPVPFKQVSHGDWRPEVGECHRNVDEWVAAHQGTAPVRGWVTIGSSGVTTRLTAHSVVRDADGQLMDITPLENEYYRVSMRFVPHIGDDQTFFAMKNAWNEIDCPEEAATGVA